MKAEVTQKRIISRAANFILYIERSAPVKDVDPQITWFFDSKVKGSNVVLIF